MRNVSLLVAISVNGEAIARSSASSRAPLRTRRAGATLSHLKQRGPQGVELIISDACMGLVESAAEFFPQVRW